jgi:hypothetical protein
MLLSLATCHIAHLRLKRALSVAMCDHRRGSRSCRTGAFIVARLQYAYADIRPSVEQVSAMYTAVSLYTTMLTVCHVLSQVIKFKCMMYVLGSKLG